MNYVLGVLIFIFIIFPIDSFAQRVYSQLVYLSGGKGTWRELARTDIPLSQLRFGDFDGDGVTDVFSSQRGRWYYLPGGREGDWLPLARSSAPIKSLRFGYFDNDNKTDVFSVQGNKYKYSSGGRSSWTNLRSTDVSINKLRFGDFDGDGLTDLFKATGNQWYYSPKSRRSWRRLARSQHPWTLLRFGNFDNDKTTDVFSAEAGRWYYLPGGREGNWKKLTRSRLTTPKLKFGNFDNNKRTDVLSWQEGRYYFISAGRSRHWTKLAPSTIGLNYVRLGDFNGDGITDLITSVRVADEGLSISKDITARLNNADVNKILASAQKVLWRNNGTGDVECFVKFHQEGDISNFSIGNGIINTKRDLERVFALPGNVKLVREINICGNEISPNIAGCAIIGGKTMVVKKQTTYLLDGIVWAHEYGHMKALRHRSNTLALMNETGTTKSQRVNFRECTNFTSIR